MSQDYTPVSWVDETTSQQGTLINAERLNQMQTAHHYADGFEEVDAIPTEDPGVDYHKVVYCTADATFYRWDGTQWTADIDEETKHLLDQEIARAEHAEGLIQGYLDAHEANHSNPHQVTKAQVGLGNCDNTADTDKPISTAAQAALDTKADKATTLAGYGITDAYTKTEADTLLVTKADVTALTDGSVTKVGTADLGTDTKPIKLVAGVPTAVGHDLVTIDTEQTITGHKTVELLTSETNILRSKYCSVASASGNASHPWRLIYTMTAPVSTNANTQITLAYSGGRAAANGGQIPAIIQIMSYGTTVRAAGVGTSSKLAVKIIKTDTGAAYVFARCDNNNSGSGATAFNAIVGRNDNRWVKQADEVRCTITNGVAVDTNGNTVVSGTEVSVVTDLVSNDDLDAYAQMVRTTGNQTIAGTKTFKADNINIEAPSGNTARSIIFTNTNTNLNASIEVNQYGSIDLKNGTNAATRAPNQRGYAAANTTDVATIGTLDQYEPMVRTTGNQEISGEKTFNNYIYAKGNAQYVNPIRLVNSTLDRADKTARSELGISLVGKDNITLGSIFYAKFANGEKQIVARLYDDNGAYHDTVLARYQGDVTQ